MDPSLLVRRKGESAEEKKARKAAVKEARRAQRSAKKEVRVRVCVCGGEGRRGKGRVGINARKVWRAGVSSGAGCMVTGGVEGGKERAAERKGGGGRGGRQGEGGRGAVSSAQRPSSIVLVPMTVYVMTFVLASR